MVFISKKSLGILIIHGFTYRLDSIHIIESAIANLELPIRTPVLRGHGAESPEALRGVTWQDWVTDAEDALQDLVTEVEKTIVIGYSLGGLVALTLAAEHPKNIDSIILAAAPVQINSPLAPSGPLHFLTSLLKRLLKKWDMPPNYVDTERAKYHTSYPWAPMDSIATLFVFSVVARNRLPEVNMPTLSLQSHNDSTAVPESANIVNDNISTPENEKQTIWFEKTEHEMFRDLEREGGVGAIQNYVQKRTGKRVCFLAKVRRNNESPRRSLYKGRSNKCSLLAGSEGSPIVFIHGLSGCIENWELNLEGLSKSHCVYAVDLVGCGLTEKPSTRYSIPYLAEFVQEFMALKNVGNSCVIGHSIGAGIAIEMCLTNPARIDRLILVDGFGFGKKLALHFRALAIPFLGKQLMKPSRSGLIQFFKMLFYDHTLITDELIDFSFERSSLPGSSEAYLATLRAHANFLGLKNDLVQNIKENVHRIVVPTTIIWGKEDKAIPVEQAYIASNLFTIANLHIIDQCGHVPQVECTEEFNRIVLESLAQ